MKNQNFLNISIKRNDSGITLIALAITIVLLLILAGVSINTLTGNNGTINRATSIKENKEKQDVKSKIDLAVTSSLYDGLETDDIDLDTLNIELQQIEGIGKIPIDKNIGLPYIVTYNNKEGILIKENGDTQWVNSTGKNLFNKDEVQDNKIISLDRNGIVVDNAWWKVSEFIKCKALTNYTISYQSGKSKLCQTIIAFYDENYNYISGVSEKKYENEKLTQQSPQNARYLKFSYSVIVSYNEVERKNIQLEEGDEVTEYEPYFDVYN